MALLHKGNADMAASCFGHGLEFCPSDRKLIEGKRKAIHLQVGGNNPEPLESTKGSAFPLSRSVTTNNEESQNFNFTGLTDWKEIDPQTAGSAAEPNEGSLNGISDRAENNEAQRNSPNDKGKMNNNFGNKESLVSVETEVSRILHAPNCKWTSFYELP